MVLALAAALAAQQRQNNVIANTVTLLAPDTPGAVPSATVIPQQTGIASYYYWIVSHAGTAAVMAGPFAAINAPTTLSAAASIHVLWSPGAGATSYDLLRTATATAPSGACNCAVAIGTASLMYVDMSNSEQSYTVPALNVPAMVINAGDGAVSSQNIEQVRYADQFTAASSTAGIQEAYNNLPSGGGTVFISAGNWTLSAAISQDPTKPAKFVCDPNAILTFTGATAGFGSISGGSSIVDCHIYSTNASSTFAVNGGYAPWAANTAYTSINNNIVPLTLTSARGLFFEATTAGTSGASEPTWPTTIGGTVTDGTVTWTAVGYTAVTLTGDTFSGWGGQEVNTGGYNYGWSIKNNTFENGGNEGILAGGGTQRTLIQGNDFHDLGSNAIDFGGGDYNTASYNTIANVGTNSGLGVDRDGIQMAAITGFNATGNQALYNYINTVGQSGIRFRGETSGGVDYTATNELAQGNIIIAPAADCVLWDASALTISGNGMDKDAAIGNTCVGPETGGFTARGAYDITSTQLDDVTNALVSGNFASGTPAFDYDLLIGGTAVDTIVSGNHFVSTAPTMWIDNASTTSLIGYNYTPLSGGQPNVFQGPLQFTKIIGPSVTISDGGSNLTALDAGLAQCGNADYFCIIPPGGSSFVFDGFGGLTVPGSLAINGGTAITAQTGSGGTMVMSASPTLTGAPKLPTYTVATLPSASTSGAGATVIVTDATSFTPGTCTGGGSDTVLAVSSGSAWVCQ